MTVDLALRAKEAIGRCRSGDFRGVGALLDALAVAAFPVEAAWSAALRARVWLAFPSRVSVPTIAELRDLRAGGADVDEPLREACEQLALVHGLAWDAGALEQVRAFHAHLAGPPSARTSTVASIHATWLALLGGAPSLALAERAVVEASAAKQPDLLVHAASLRALASACAGDVETATALARRASLMGRSEGLPQEEYLAHLVLARVRRMGRQAHRSIRILHSLRELASPPWQGWIAWEQAFAAGDLPQPFPRFERPVDGAVSALAQVLTSARSGRRPSFDRDVLLLAQTVRRCVFAAEEAAQLTETLGAPPSRDPLPWTRGASPLLPPALHGFRTRAPEATPTGSASAYVVVTHDAGEGSFGARRVLSWAKGLAEAEGSAELLQSRRVEGRVETLLAVLALARDEGIAEDDAFAQTYDFAYVAERHRTVFDVLVHRTRAYVEGQATLERVGGRLVLRPRCSMLIPDPRCAERVSDRILRLLAQRGHANARGMASELGISLRGAQEALSELAGAGACESRRDGRAVRYVVEDTTFSEPTTRLHAAQLE